MRNQETITSNLDLEDWRELVENMTREMEEDPMPKNMISDAIRDGMIFDLHENNFTYDEMADKYGRSVPQMRELRKLKWYQNSVRRVVTDTEKLRKMGILHSTRVFSGLENQKLLDKGIRNAMQFEAIRRLHEHGISQETILNAYGIDREDLKKVLLVNVFSQ